MIMEPTHIYRYVCMYTHTYTPETNSEKIGCQVYLLNFHQNFASPPSQPPANTASSCNDALMPP